MIALNHVVNITKGAIKWLLLVDIDEFMITTHFSSLKSLLSSDFYQNYPAVCGHWYLFGSNGHVNRPAGLVISNYVRRSPKVEKWSVKCMIQVDRVREFYNVHFAFYDKSKEVTQYNEPVPENLVVFHYAFKSIADWKERIRKGNQ